MSNNPIEEIESEKQYMMSAAGKLIGLGYKQVGRLVDAGIFPNAGRKSTLPNSPRVIPGSDLITYLKEKENKESLPPTKV